MEEGMSNEEVAIYLQTLLVLPTPPQSQAP